MRLFERELRADCSTGVALLPTRTTHASNFSFANRSGFSPDTVMASMPNCRKHSDNRLLVFSCKSTRAARAENLRLGMGGTREFPNVFSVFCCRCLLALLGEFKSVSLCGNDQILSLAFRARELESQSNRL